MGGVQSCRPFLKSKLFDTDKILCLYDNDTAGLKGKKDLAGDMGRMIFTVDFPLREDSKGKTLSDINDFYRV